MFKQKSLEDLIREHVFLGNISNTGFYQFKCPCCHDYKVRAGLKFEGGVVQYNCFNCGRKPAYTENSGVISKKMRECLLALGIPDQEINNTVNVAFFNKDASDQNITLDKITKKSIVVPTISLPSNSFRLNSTDEFKDEQEAINKYLRGRMIDPNSYPFYFSSDDYFKNRVIIPFYKNKKVIYWQARSIDDIGERYLNCTISKNAVFFNYDKLFSWSELPLFIVEGVFDALSVDGVGTLGSAINEEKIEILNSSTRRKIVVVDRDSNGKKVGELALANNWEITFAPEGCDINKSIITYGRLWTIYELMNNIPKTQFEAQTKINLNCKGKK